MAEDTFRIHTFLEQQRPQSTLSRYIGWRLLPQHRFGCCNFSGGYRFYATVVKDAKANSAAPPCGMEP